MGITRSEVKKIALKKFNLSDLQEHEFEQIFDTLDTSRELNYYIVIKECKLSNKQVIESWFNTLMLSLPFAVGISITAVLALGLNPQLIAVNVITAFVASSLGTIMIHQVYSLKWRYKEHRATMEELYPVLASIEFKRYDLSLNQ